ncbi:MAG TPA: GapR family DNA-binding domain-containing protein [Rhizomicrobium sp.]|nr:GapR family DNA-binding domain-containing protein [Rhizomicrobium sp.]
MRFAHRSSPKIMRQVVRMRKLDKADFQEQEAVLDLYLSALGMR